jgi:hypothetical protein
MQTSELVELAAVVAERGPTLALGLDSIGLPGLEEYWAAAKCRFDRWGRALHRIRTQEPPYFDEPAGNRPVGTVRGLIEEILGSEVLTRVWTAVVTAFDRRRDAQDNEIVARSVYIGHQELRQRVLKLLVLGPGVPSGEAVELNRLRRRAELWTDLLLARLMRTHDVCEFGFETPRLRRFAANLASASAMEVREDDLAPHDFGGGDSAALAETSLLMSVRHSFHAAAPNPDMNQRVAASVLGAFAAPHFDSCGVFRSLWMLRIAATADETQRLITEMFRADAQSTGTQSTDPRGADLVDHGPPKPSLPASLLPKRHRFG